jgi:hypothetical protein
MNDRAKGKMQRAKVWINAPCLNRVVKPRFSLCPFPFALLRKVVALALVCCLVAESGFAVPAREALCVKRLAKCTLHEVRPSVFDEQALLLAGVCFLGAYHPHAAAEVLASASHLLQMRPLTMKHSGSFSPGAPAPESLG